MSTTSQAVSTMGQATGRANLPRPGSPGKLGYGIPIISATANAFGRISSGEKVLPSIAKAAGQAIVDDMMFALLGPVGAGVLFGGQIATMAAGLAIQNGKQNTNNLSNAMGNSRSSNVINSNSAATMRQRGMAMINQNGEATRSALGSEARAYFRNSMY